MWKSNKNVPALLRRLKEVYPHPTCALNHKSPFQLLIATILSAQCTDERVNKVTPDLFARYQTPKELAGAAPHEVEMLIRSTGFFRSKARSILGTSRLLTEKFQERVPKTMTELLELPGVARKTANVVLGTAFGIPDGVVVDTHVTRLSQRLGLSRKTTAEKIEKDLIQKIPRTDWIWFSHALITHGRAICKARAPECGRCPVRKECTNPVFPSEIREARAGTL